MSSESTSNPGLIPDGPVIFLNEVRGYFAQAVYILNKRAVNGIITLENEYSQQTIRASWLYVQSKTLLSNASATYLPDPSEVPDLKINGILPTSPPIGWLHPALIRLKEEEVLASNRILEEKPSLFYVSWGYRRTAVARKSVGRLSPFSAKAFAKKQRVIEESRPILTSKISTPSPKNPRRSTRLSGVQYPDKDSERPAKRSITPVESGSNKRSKVSSPDRYADLVDPEIPGLPWQMLTTTMKERAIGYLDRNTINRQPGKCLRCRQQASAREKIGEDCITMFDSQGGSIACFRCGYRQLTCSFANGALAVRTPSEIEPSESSQPETVQTTIASSSDSVVKDVAEHRFPLTNDAIEGLPQKAVDNEIPSSTANPVDETTPTPRSPNPDVDGNNTIQRRESSIPDTELVESQVQVTSPRPDEGLNLFYDGIPSPDRVGSLASVLTENPMLRRRGSLRTYSRNDRTTMPPPEKDVDSRGSDRLYTLRPAFSSGGSNFPDFDGDDDDFGFSNSQRLTESRPLRSCSLRELPRPGTGDSIHESVHHFRALLHTHQGIIKMRQHIFSLLHANDSALRHSRQSLLNATTQLKQYPFPWDIPDGPPFDGLKDLGDDLVCAWSNGFDERKAYESIQKYDRAQLDVDRHAVDPVEEELDPFYYPNISKAWTDGSKNTIE